VIEHREALIYMLCEAAELEHAIMCQYLYAAFSLKQGTDEGLSARELTTVERWRKTVTHIATQEMLHLTLVQNLLSAVGAAPHLSRPNLPQPAGHYPPGVVLTLLPFGEAALRHFMFLERPEGMDLADAPGLEAAARAAPVMQAGEIVPRLQDFATVGHLYRSIEEGIKHLSAKYGESWLFVGPPEAQASEQHFGWSQLVQVTDAASAQRAIDTILQQGEGPRGHWRRAHFGSFVEILDEYERLKDHNPGFEPARPVLPTRVRPSEGDHTTPLIGDRFTACCTDLFNVSYEILLQALARYFAHTDETGPQLAALAQVTLGLMFTVIKPLGQLITTLPVGEEAPGRTAGPSFELFYESDYVLPHRDAAWALIEERLREAAAFADRVKEQGTPDVVARLEPIGPALLAVAHNLATCRAEWGGRSHAGEVTVARRRRDAELARADEAVAEEIGHLATSLSGAFQQEHSSALRVLLAAAALSGPAGNHVEPERSTAARAGRMALLHEFERRFDNTVNLADLLVAVNGDTVLALPDLGDALELSSPRFPANTLEALTDARDAEHAAGYASVVRRLRAVPGEALLIDPHPSPTFSAEEQRQPLPGIVDQASALALMAAIAGAGTRPGTGSSSPEGSTPAQLAGQLGATTPVPSGSIATRVTDEGLSPALARLFTDALHVQLVVLGRSLMGEADPVAARHRYREVAARLARSVLRPLADALLQVTVDPGAALSAAYRARGAARTARFEELLRTAATAATDAITSFAGGPPELLEAAAALQELALAHAAHGDDNQAALRERFRQAEAGVARSVQLVPNGPYVLTNVDDLVDGLGDPILTRPQMALCRCGESARKPWCDGSHASAGFVDGKDPNRVPDRRDTYPGVALTVLDNRGTCQHSGYCTNRLPLAFRVDEEPFVAPSGGRMDEIVRAVRDCPSGALSYSVDGREARDDVDWHDERAPAVSVTIDGPYRVTGAVQLVDATGTPVVRNEGASMEHYALCRCGHSQNKPFCSGMHWYVGFRDPIPDPARPPTLYEWCGGLPALTRVTRLFFERYVPEDPLLAPLFSDVPPDVAARVAEWLGEVFGGPRRHPDGVGGSPQLLARRDGREVSEPQRARWVQLFSRAAQDAGLSSDPAFWSAFAAYLEWGSRQAAELSAVPVSPEPTRPRWDWGPAGPPAPQVDVTTGSAGTDVAPPGPGDPVSFAAHIQPLFRQRDRQSMAFAFDLGSYDAVREHAQAIIERLRAGTMPCDGPWPAQKTELFQRWVDDGTPP
jgi:CDGSH-type Zn-finger protein/truncated hemoglobin YjbI